MRQPGEANADKERGVGDVLSDGVVTVKVNAAFAANKNQSALDITVDTHPGIVTLRGYINSKEVIVEAVRMAKHVDGVKKVKSLLVVEKSR